MSPSWILTAVLICIILISQTCFCNVLRLNSDLMISHTHSIFRTSNRFTVDHKKGRFILNGSPVVLLGADMQYYRIPRPYWRQRLGALRRSGLNTVHVALEWSTHEPSPGVFRFTGEEDFVLFIRLAQEEGLLVVVRPGPFIDDERDFGGYPSWLLWDKPHGATRATNIAYKESVMRYMGETLSRLKPLLAEHGGPVIMLEMECDVTEHTTWLLSLTRHHLGEGVVVLNRSDRVQHMRDISEKQSYLQDVTTRLFYQASDTRPLIHTVSQVPPKGPRHAHYSTAWAKLWGYYNREAMTSYRLKTVLLEAVAENISVCISSFHGGTDFAFKSGAWIQPVTSFYSTQTTSVDVAAPLDEAGDETELYYAIAETLNNSAAKREKLEPVINKKKKLSLGPIVLRPIGCLLDNVTRTALSSHSLHDKLPKSFEELRQASGFVLYETVIGRDYASPVLRIPELRDRAQVYVDQEFQGTLSRDTEDFTMYLPEVKAGSRLQVFVEDQGRTYWDPVKDFVLYKGLTYGGEVHLNRATLYGWSSLGFPLDDVDKLHHYADQVENGSHLVSGTPTLYAGQFVLPEDKDNPIPDTYLDLRANWSKGVVFLNGHNLGRYWVTRGPQVTLFVPGCRLLPAPQVNKLLVLELQHPVVQQPIAWLVDHHVTIQVATRMSLVTSLAGFVLLLMLLLMFTSGIKYANWVRRM